MLQGEVDPDVGKLLLTIHQLVSHLPFPFLLGSVLFPCHLFLLLLRFSCTIIPFGRMNDLIYIPFLSYFLGCRLSSMYELYVTVTMQGDSAVISTLKIESDRG